MLDKPGPDGMREGNGAAPSDAGHATPKALANAERVTPMMAQYIEIKAANPDLLLFYRMGDFYELFFGDAEIASRCLGIMLTRRGKHQGIDIPMCGVPVERADDYLHRLIAAGHRVAVCEQTEDPAEARKRGGKSVVRRDVTRLVTPGTVTEEGLLDPGSASLLAAVARARAGDDGFAYGLALVDITTGRFRVQEIATPEGLAAEIARAEPREIVVPDALFDDPDLKALWRDTRAAVTPTARDGYDGAAAERRLLDYFGVASLDAFGPFTRPERAAAAAVVAYVERTQMGARAALDPPSRLAEGGAMAIDAATRANLELTRTLSGEREGSLLSAIDRTLTPGGARLLAERLGGPLTDPARIAQRLDAVEYLKDDGLLRARLRESLKRAPDAGRALSRLALGRGGPRDLAAIAGMIAAGLAIAERIPPAKAPAEIAAAASLLAGLDGALGARIAASLCDAPPLRAGEGGLIREGVLPALDEARRLRDETRLVVAGLQARYADLTGCRGLRVKHNGQLGYFIELPQAAGDALLKGEHAALFVHRQTMTGAMRFSTAELAALDSAIASAGERALALELDLFEELRAGLVLAGDAIRAGAGALAVIDVSAGLAELAASQGWTRPTVDASTAFRLNGARHPVVEAALTRGGQAFVANGVDLSGASEAGRILLVTGPNMAGKSTYLRQAALVAVLAQAGAFVPAAEAHVGIVDRLFSRVGAADDLARGRSTFMVEMIETAAILHQAGPRSLVILDEIGRGTATFDGLSIAWASLEHLHEVNRCRTLFATHFRELARLTATLPRLACASMRVTEHAGDIVFLHEVAPGAADRSYGVQVAKLAGLPAAAVDRARAILAELEAEGPRKPQARLDDLPLFSAARTAPVAEPARVDALRGALDGFDPDAMSPREALEALYALKVQRAKERGP